MQSEWVWVYGCVWMGVCMCIRGADFPPGVAIEMDMGVCVSVRVSAQENRSWEKLRLSPATTTSTVHPTDAGKRGPSASLATQPRVPSGAPLPIPFPSPLPRGSEPTWLKRLPTAPSAAASSARRPPGIPPRAPSLASPRLGVAARNPPRGARAYPPPPRCSRPASLRRSPKHCVQQQFPIACRPGAAARRRRRLRRRRAPARAPQPQPHPRGPSPGQGGRASGSGPRTAGAAQRCAPGQAEALATKAARGYFSGRRRRASRSAGRAAPASLAIRTARTSRASVPAEQPPEQASPGVRAQAPPSRACAPDTPPGLSGAAIGALASAPPLPAASVSTLPLAAGGCRPRANPSWAAADRSRGAFLSVSFLSLPVSALPGVVPSGSPPAELLRELHFRLLEASAWRFPER